jgi:hypothetical protein
LIAVRLDVYSEAPMGMPGSLTMVAGTLTD